MLFDDMQAPMTDGGAADEGTEETTGEGMEEKKDGEATSTEAM